MQWCEEAGSAALEDQQCSHRTPLKRPGSAASSYSSRTNDDAATADQLEPCMTMHVKNIYSSASSVALFAELLATNKSEAERQAVVTEIQQRARQGCHTEDLVQALLASHPDTLEYMLHSLFDLATDPNHSNPLISASCSAACEALTAAISCYALVEAELQRQLLKVLIASEGLLLAGLEHGSPAAKTLSVQVCLQLFRPAAGQRRIATSADGIRWLQTLLAALGIQQVAGQAAVAGAAAASSSCHQLQPEPSMAWALLEAIVCVTEHTLTTGQLCAKSSSCATGGGRTKYKQCDCGSCKQLAVMNLRPLLRAMQHGSSKAAAALAVLAGSTGVQRQLATQQVVAELLCISWQHRDTATGLVTEDVVCKLVQPSTLGSRALEQHMQAVVAALEQYAFLSPTDLARPLAGCHALLKMTAKPGAVPGKMVLQLHAALSACIPALVQVADLSAVQQAHVMHVDAAATPAAAASTLLQTLADHQPQLLAGTLVQHPDSLQLVLAAVDSTEVSQSSISAAGHLLLAATGASVQGSTCLLMTLSKQPHLSSIVQQLHSGHRTAAVLVGRLAAQHPLDAAWLQHEVLQQVMDVAGSADTPTYTAECEFGASAGGCSSACGYPTPASAAKAVLAAFATQQTAVLAGQLKESRESLLCLLKAAEKEEDERSQVGAAGSLLVAATEGSVAGSVALLEALGSSRQLFHGVLHLLCLKGNRTAAVLVHRMSGLQQLDEALLKPRRLEQLVQAALPSSAPNQEASSYALKSVWALFSRPAAQSKLQQLPLQLLLLVVEALAVQAMYAQDESADNMPAMMAALTFETQAADPCGEGQAGCRHSNGQQQQALQGAVAALQLIAVAATDEGAGAVAVAWEVLLRLSRNAEVCGVCGCGVLLSSKADHQSVLPVLMKHLSCSPAAPFQQTAGGQASRDAMLVNTLAGDHNAAAAVDSSSAAKAAAVMAGLAIHEPEELTLALKKQQQQQQDGFSVVLQAMFHSTDCSVAKNVCAALRQLTAGPAATQASLLVTAVECTRSCSGMLVQLMQQGWVAASRVLASFAKVAAAEQSCKLLQHLPGLELAGTSCNPEVAAAAARMLQGIAASDCVDNISQLWQWTQQGSTAAAQLLVEVAKLPAAKQPLLQHLPAMIGATECSAAADKVLQAWVVPECVCHVGELVQLVKQDSELAPAAAAATMLLRLMQLPGGEPAVLQHLPALVMAAGCTSATGAAAAARVLHVLAVPGCISHLDDLLQLMQQGNMAAAKLVMQLCKLPAAKTVLLQHVPLLVAAVAVDSDDIVQAAVHILHHLACCSTANGGNTGMNVVKAGAAALAQQDLMMLVRCISQKPAVAAMCINIVAAAVQRLTVATTSTAALQKYIPELLAAAEALAATGSVDRQGMADLVVSAVAAAAGHGAAGLEVLHACLPHLAAALCSTSTCRAIASEALKALHLLLMSRDNSKPAAVLRVVAQQKCLGHLVLRLKDGCATAAEFITCISEAPSLKVQLLQHLPALLHALADHTCNHAAATAAALVLCRITLDSRLPHSTAQGPPEYAGSAGKAALAGCDLAPLVLGMLSKSGLSHNCAAALHNVALTAAGRQALCKHTAGLVEALHTAHACSVAELAFDTIKYVCGSTEAGQGAVLQHLAAIAYAVHQRLESTSIFQPKIRRSYVWLVQQLLEAVEGLAFFSRPAILAELLTHLQFQFANGAESVDREAAGSCIEALAAAALDDLWAVQHWQLHKRLKDAAAKVKEAAKAARAAAERRAAEAAWFAGLQDAVATFPTQDVLSALSAAELKTKLMQEVGLSADILQGTNKQSDLLQLFQECSKIWEAQRVNRCGQLIEKQPKGSRKRLEASAALLRVTCATGEDPWHAVAAVGERQIIKTYKLLAAMVHPDNMSKKITAVLKNLVAGEARCSALDLLGHDAAKQLFDEAMQALGNAFDLCKKCAKTK